MNHSSRVPSASIPSHAEPSVAAVRGANSGKAGEVMAFGGRGLVLPHNVEDAIKRAIAQVEPGPSRNVCRAPPVPTVDMSDPRVQRNLGLLVRAWAQVAHESPGQPRMGERFCLALSVVQVLESAEIPFATGTNSRMNQALRLVLNDLVDPSAEMKSRRKRIGATAVRALLKDIRYYRSITHHFLQLAISQGREDI
jgi:hypothetical protein